MDSVATETIIQQINFVIIILFAGIVSPIAGYWEYKQLKEEIAQGKNNKLKQYQNTILWSWIPIIFIVLLIPLSGLKIEDIGLRKIDIASSSLSNWIAIPVIAIYIIYLFYNIYSIIILKYSKETRVKSAEQIPQEYWVFLPVTQKEKQTWDWVALTAGITEEILYRGYIFFALALFYPNISLAIILLISTCLFGIGHIYQGVDAIKPTIIGLLFGVFYITFNSLLPVILIHIVQDLVVRNLLDEKPTSP
jgi:membrane protease YdiL (CAAX protease family)